MRVFVAGGTGVLGRRLVPQLVARGHQVTATTTSAARLGVLEQLGAEAVVMDGLDPVSVGEAVARARPEVIVHQMTGISLAHAGAPAAASSCTGRPPGVSSPSPPTTCTVSGSPQPRPSACALLQRPGGLTDLESKAIQAAAQGRLRPVIGQRYALADAAAAHTAIESRSTTGKTILRP